MKWLDSHTDTDSIQRLTQELAVSPLLARLLVGVALALINQTLDEVLAKQEGEFDPETRWAVAWFEQFGFNEGPFGIAETLSKAKNTAVGALDAAGILISKVGTRCGDLGDERATLDGAPSLNHDHRIPGRADGPPRFPRRGGDSDLEESSGSTDLLPRRAVDALGAGKGGNQAAGPKRSAPDRLAATRHHRAPQPPAPDGPSHLRQLPFVFP